MQYNGLDPPLLAKSALLLCRIFVKAATAGGGCEGGHEAAPNSPNGVRQVT